MLHLLDFFHFIRLPDKTRLDISGARALLVTLVFFVFLMPLTLLLSIPANLWPDPQNFLVDMITESLSEPTLYTVFFMVMLGPLWEELMFRYPLRLSPRRILTAGVFFVGFMTMDLWSLMDPRRLEILENLTPELVYFAEMLVQMLLAAGLSLGLPRTFPGVDWDGEWTTSSALQWGLWVHAAAFVFAQMHLFNYQILRWEGWVLAFLLNLPRWFLGLGLSYVRMRLGLVWAVVLHITNNAFFVLLYRLSGAAA